MAALFSENAILMPPNVATKVGNKAIKKEYAELFEAVYVDITFYIDEIIIVDDRVIVRSTSSGITKLVDSMESSPEVNRELFVLQKIKDKWLITHYMYNKMSY